MFNAIDLIYREREKGRESEMSFKDEFHSEVTFI